MFWHVSILSVPVASVLTLVYTFQRKKSCGGSAPAKDVFQSEYTAILKPT